MLEISNRAHLHVGGLFYSLLSSADMRLPLPTIGLVCFVCLFVFVKFCFDFIVHERIKNK